MKTVVEAVAEAIAESTRTGGYARLEAADSSIDTYASLAEHAAKESGLEAYRIKTPEGCDVIACPEGKPDLWKLSFVSDGIDYTCEECQGSGMTILPFGAVDWCECARFGLDDVNPPPLPAAWHNVRERIERRLAGQPEADNGTTLRDERSWPVAAAEVLRLKEARQ